MAGGLVCVFVCPEVKDSAKETMNKFVHCIPEKRP
jgi:hypothetical protein